MTGSSSVAPKATTTVVIEGDLTASRVGPVRTQIKSIVGQGARQVVIDLSGCTFVDSSGIGLMVATHNTLSRAGGTLSLIHVSAELRELFQTMRLHQHFSIQQ